MSNDQKLLEIHGMVCRLDERTKCLPELEGKIEELVKAENQRKGAAKLAVAISSFAGLLASVSAIFTWFKN